MIIDELVIKNFGVYAGEQRCHFTGTSPDQPIILFGGLNGAGKTTLMDAVQLALYGKMAQCSNRGTLSYENYLKASINRATPPDDETGVELAFRYRADERDCRYHIKRYWHRVGESIRERFEVERNGMPDTVLAESWLPHIEQLIPVSLTQLFFFDGERLAALTDPKKTANFIRTTIHALHGLNIVDRLQNDLNVLKRRQAAQQRDEIVTLDAQIADTSDPNARVALQTQRDALAEKAAPNDVVAKIDDEIEALKTTQEQLTGEHGKLNIALRRARTKREAADETFRTKGGDLYEQKTELEQSHKECEERLRSLDQTLQHYAADASLPFVLVPELIEQLREQDTHEMAQLPPSRLDSVLQYRDHDTLAQVAAQATSLSIPHDTLRAITQALDEFLESDRAHRNAAAVQAVIDLTAQDRKTLHDLAAHHGDLFHELRTTVAQRDESAAQRLDIDRQLQQVPDEDTLQQIHSDRQEKIKKQRDAQKAVITKKLELDAIEADATDAHGTVLKDDEDNPIQVGTLPTLEKQKEREHIKQAEAALEANDAQRIIKHATQAQTVLDTFLTQVVQQHLSRIEQLILDCFQSLLRKQDLVTHITIDPNDCHLRLTGADGHELAPERLSAGERQLLAVAILWGLRKATQQPFPAMIDTPLSRLDGTHRKTVLQQYFPQASDQVVLLSTDEEINKAGVETLQHSIAKSYRLNYDDATNATTISPGYFW